MSEDFNKNIIEESILKIGNVTSVEGRSVKIKVDKTKNSSHLIFNGKPLKNISVGGYVKILKGYEIMVGKIDGEYISEVKTPLNDENYNNPSDKIDRIIDIKLIGFYENAIFKKGVKEMPLIDNECHLLTIDEYFHIHAFVSEGDRPLNLGTLTSDKDLEIKIGVKKLFASHMGIFGNTGSGKSYTLANIYNKLFNEFKSSKNFLKNAKFVIIDFNGEYINLDNRKEDKIICAPNIKETYNLSTKEINPKDKLPLPTDVINDETLWIIASDATDKTQTPFIRRSLNSKTTKKLINSKTFREVVSEILLTMCVSKNNVFQQDIYNIITDIELAHKDIDLQKIKSKILKIKFHNVTKEYYIDGATDCYANKEIFKTELNKITSDLDIGIDKLDIFTQIYLKIIVQYYYEISRGYANKEHLSPMIKRLQTRIKDFSKVFKPSSSFFTDDKPLAVISLKNVNIQMRKIIPLLVCKELYENKKSSSEKNTYLNIIIDEAHNILSSDSVRESEQWKDYRLETFEEIIKEGRKFGIFLTIASQRPSDISPTIISQLHNYFLHRLINERDLQAIQNTVSFLDKLSFESLPILPTGTCIISGLITQTPVIVDITQLSPEESPASDTYDPIKNWI